jgi:hypothetical protein
VSTPSYAERLYVPLRWWVQAIMFIATGWIAMIVSMPTFWAWFFTAVLLALLSGWFLSLGSARIAVVDGRLQAGRASIEAGFLGRAEALDPEAARLVAGRDADARAFLLLRPYLHRAVKVEINDPADPAPYWLLSTRRPDKLAAALSQLSRA